MASPMRILGINLCSSPRNVVTLMPEPLLWWRSSLKCLWWCGFIHLCNKICWGKEGAEAEVSGSVAGKRLHRASSAGAKVTPPATGDKRAKLLLLASVLAFTGLWFQKEKLTFFALFHKGKVILDVSTDHSNITYK